MVSQQLIAWQVRDKTELVYFIELVTIIPMISQLSGSEYQARDLILFRFDYNIFLQNFLQNGGDTKNFSSKIKLVFNLVFYLFFCVLPRRKRKSISQN